MQWKTSDKNLHIKLPKTVSSSRWLEKKKQQCAEKSFLYLNGEEKLSCPLLDPEDNVWLKQTLRQHKEFQKSNLSHFFGSHEPNPQIHL